jgi:hypothetical protein
MELPEFLNLEVDTDTPRWAKEFFWSLILIGLFILDFFLGCILVLAIMERLAA